METLTKNQKKMLEIETSHIDKAKGCKKAELNIQELQDKYKRGKIHVMRLSGEERKKEQKKYLK